MRVFVTGGAGYIGSVVTELLADAGHDVAVFDNLSSGWRVAVDPRARFLQGDLLEDSLDEALASERPDAVCHLAAEVAVGESMADPGLHYRANLIGSLRLAEAVVRTGVERIVFSSTAAVYGEPESLPIAEDAPLNPANVYGETKLAFERALAWYGKIHGLRHLSLRYFNACGATAAHGEFRRRETHIVPILLEAALGLRDGFTLFGDDYPTPDGTCVRDYVHVEDIARAHVLALERIDDLPSGALNLGIGRGYSNREVAQAVKRASGVDFPIHLGPRRPGDPAALIASGEAARRSLGWKPVHTDLQAMADSAWEWRRRHPHGYGPA